MYNEKNINASKSEKDFKSQSLATPAKTPDLIQTVETIERFRLKKKIIVNRILWCLVTFGPQFYTRQRVIASWCHCSVRHVQRVIDELVACNALTKDYRPMTSCIYTFNPILLERSVQKRLAKTYRALRFLTEDEWSVLPVYTEIPEEKKTKNVVLLKRKIKNLVFLEVSCTDLNNSNQGESTREGDKKQIQEKKPIDFLKNFFKVNSCRDTNDTKYLKGELMTEFVYNAEMVSQIFTMVTGNKLTDQQAQEIATWSSDQINIVFSKVKKIINDEAKRGNKKNITSGYVFKMKSDMYPAQAELTDEKKQQLDAVCASVCQSPIFENTVPAVNYSDSDGDVKRPKAFRSLKEQIAALKEEEEHGKKTYSESFHYKKHLTQPFKPKYTDFDKEGRIKKQIVDSEIWQKYQQVIGPDVPRPVFQGLEEGEKKARKEWDTLSDETKAEAQAAADRILYTDRQCPIAKKITWLSCANKIKDLQEYRARIRQDQAAINPHIYRYEPKDGMLYYVKDGSPACPRHGNDEA